MHSSPFDSLFCFPFSTFSPTAGFLCCCAPKRSRNAIVHPYIPHHVPLCGRTVESLQKIFSFKTYITGKAHNFLWWEACKSFTVACHRSNLNYGGMRGNFFVGRWVNFHIQRALREREEKLDSISSKSSSSRLYPFSRHSSIAYLVNVISILFPNFLVRTPSKPPSRRRMKRGTRYIHDSIIFILAFPSLTFPPSSTV